MEWTLARSIYAILQKLLRELERMGEHIPFAQRELIWIEGTSFQICKEQFTGGNAEGVWPSVHDGKLHTFQRHQSLGRSVIAGIIGEQN